MLSDHKPLTFALHRQSDAWSARQQRHLSYVAEYTSVIRHVPGKENVVADCLSRPPEELSLPRSTHVASVKVPSGSLAAPVARDGSPGASTVAVVTPVLDMVELACAQDAYQETQQPRAKLDAQDVLIYGNKIWCDSSTGVLRPLIPDSMHRLVFNSVHSLAHPGIRATRRMLTSRFVWTSCSRDVNTWCQERQHCTCAKIQPQEKTAVDAIPVPLHKFSPRARGSSGPLATNSRGPHQLADSGG